MAMSGVTIHDNCVTAFEDLKRKKASRYLIFTIENTTTIVISHKGERSEKYEDFIAKFTTESPAYGVFDFEYDTPDGPREKMILISWIPDSSKPRSRMLYSSSKVAIDNLDSSLLSIQANDASDLAREAVLAKIKSHKSG